MSDNKEQKVKIDDNHILLSLQTALLGNITPSIRMVAVDWNDTAITIRAYYDGEVSEKDRELMECATTEVMADFFPQRKVELEVVRKDAPAPMEQLRAVVYARNED